MVCGARNETGMLITDLQQTRRSPRRLSVYLDGEFAFACFAELVSRYGLRRGAELDEETVAQLRAEDEQIAAREYALGLAARGPRSERQFRDKLRERGYGEAGTGAALEVLAAYGYLDDEAYARQYAAELSAKFGVHRIRQKLAERGISSEIIGRVTAQADTGPALREQLERAAARPRYEDERRERDRIIRALAAKGFAYDDIRAALRERDGDEE